MCKQRKGQSLVEYVLILALVSCVSIYALTILGTNVKSILLTVAHKLEYSSQYSGYSQDQDITPDRCVYYNSHHYYCYY